MKALKALLGYVMIIVLVALLAGFLGLSLSWFWWWFLTGWEAFQ